MAKVEIRCPSCKKSKKIEVSLEKIKRLSRGLMAINISQDIICEHSFIAYIDKNLAVRDYFIADFQVELPEISSIEKIRAEDVSDKDIVDVDLIKLNIHAKQLTYILKSIFSRSSIVIVSDQTFLYEHFHKFFEYITKGSFEIEISYITEDVFQSNKKDYKNSMVFKGNEILRNSKKLINPKKLFIEKQIVNKFLTTHDLGYSFIFLKNEIQKVYELVKSIFDFIKIEEQTRNKINTLRITADLERRFKVKLNPIYINFLIDVVENYYNILIPSISDSFLDSL